MSETAQNRDSEQSHWHTTMESHGAERDALHKHGHIPHTHGKPILLTSDDQERKMTSTNNQEGDSQ